MQAEPTAHDKNYSPHSPEPSELSPISTPSINHSTIDGCETPHATTDDNTFYSEDEPRRNLLGNVAKKLASRRMRNPEGSCSNDVPHLQHHHQSRKEGSTWGYPFRKKGGVSQNASEACGQVFPTEKDIPGPFPQSKLRLNKQ